MTTNLKVGDRFPDFELPNQDKELIKLSMLTQPSLMDQYIGFSDGYPLILVFYRGFFCPRDRAQLPQLFSLKLNQLHAPQLSPKKRLEISLLLVLSVNQQAEV